MFILSRNHNSCTTYPHIGGSCIRRTDQDRRRKQRETITKVIQDVESIDFGSFPQLEKQERKFTLTNTGQHVLVIYDVITSCGCTRVNYSKEGIRPGEKAVLTVIYEAEKAEHFSKTVTIYCNADNSPLRLKITGNAE